MALSSQGGGFIAVEGVFNEESKTFSAGRECFTSSDFFWVFNTWKQQSGRCIDQVWYLLFSPRAWVAGQRCKGQSAPGICREYDVLEFMAAQVMNLRSMTGPFFRLQAENLCNGRILKDQIVLNWFVLVFIANVSSTTCLCLDHLSEAVHSHPSNPHSHPFPAKNQ